MVSLFAFTPMRKKIGEQMPVSEGLLQPDNVKVRRRELTASLLPSLPRRRFLTQTPQKGKIKMKTPLLKHLVRDLGGAKLTAGISRTEIPVS